MVNYKDGGLIKMVDYSKWWITQNGGLIKMVGFLSWWIIQNGGLFKMVDNSKWWIIKIGGFNKMVDLLNEEFIKYRLQIKCLDLNMILSRLMIRILASPQTRQI